MASLCLGAWQAPGGPSALLQWAQLSAVPTLLPLPGHLLHLLRLPWGLASCRTLAPLRSRSTWRFPESLHRPPTVRTLTPGEWLALGLWKDEWCVLSLISSLPPCAPQGGPPLLCFRFAWPCPVPGTHGGRRCRSPSCPQWLLAALGWSGVQPVAPLWPAGQAARCAGAGG